MRATVAQKQTAATLATLAEQVETLTGLIAMLNEQVVIVHRRLDDLIAASKPDANADADTGADAATEADAVNKRKR